MLIVSYSWLEGEGPDCDTLVHFYLRPTRTRVGHVGRWVRVHSRVTDMLRDKGITQTLRGTPVFTFYMPGKVISAEDTSERKRLQSPPS